MSKTKTKQANAPAAVTTSQAQEEDGVDIKQQTTEELWRSVNDRHAGVEAARATMRSAIRITNDCALEAGEILDELKNRTPRGKWLKTLEANCSVGIREAQRYINLYLNQEVLDEQYPDWRSSLTMVEALEEISFHRSKKSSEVIQETRKSRAGSVSKAEKPTKTQIRQTPKAKVKVQSLAQVKAVFKPFRQQITAIQHAVDQVKKAQTLDRIEAEAIAVAARCEDLVGQCRRKKAAINGGYPGRIDLTINGKPIKQPPVSLPGRKTKSTPSSRATDHFSVAGGTKA